VPEVLGLPFRHFCHPSASVFGELHEALGAVLCEENGFSPSPMYTEDIYISINYRYSLRIRL
jgi:hypothetical protein